jgi:NADP-dependent 3-hydroxy acid dehydrogenase YdfG
MTALRVVVTGGSSGIGAEIARQYAAGGARIALFARRRDKLEQVADQCRRLGAAEACVLEGDTTDAERVRAATATLVESWSGIDRAYLNAGGYGVTDSLEMQRARDLEWTATGFRAAAAEAVMRVNYLGVTYWLEAVLSVMRAQRTGTIAVTGAQTADRGFPAHGPYAAAKAALRALCDSLRPDAARFGIILSLLEPSPRTTAATRCRSCSRPRRR